MPEHPDPSYVFSKEYFLEEYKVKGGLILMDDNRDDESFTTFLEDFVSRPAFCVLIEQWIDNNEKDYSDLYAF